MKSFEFRLTVQSLTGDAGGKPALSLFLWEDGAEWDWMMNYVTNDPSSEPPDPTIVGSLFRNESLIEKVQIGNGTLLGSY